jgi:hypothetical protein
MKSSLPVAVFQKGTISAPQPSGKGKDVSGAAPAADDILLAIRWLIAYKEPIG